MNSPHSSPAQVLIVDDELANIQVLAEALGKSFDIRFANNATRALELAVEQPPDVILLDVVMPGMDGFEALRWLKSEPRTRHVPVIFVTAMDEMEDETRGFALGAVDYIIKPISPAIVRARVRTHAELKRQRDLLEEHAALDGLTGIANRRRFDAEFDARWRAAQRAGEEITLMLVDVDHFKQYNDHYGHAAGDDCLRQVANALHGRFSRGDDFAARYGGEEFALLLPGGDVAGQARRALDAVAQLRLPHARSSAGDQVSISIGAWQLTRAHAATPREVLESVDKLLYLAKREGRNRCVYRHQGDADQHVVLLEGEPP